MSAPSRCPFSVVIRRRSGAASVRAGGPSAGQAARWQTQLKEVEAAPNMTSTVSNTFTQNNSTVEKKKLWFGNVTISDSLLIRLKYLHF